MKKVVLIIPCYNEEESIPFIYEAISGVSKTISNYEFELLFINDGSSDSTFSKLKELSAVDECVKYISFSRNFGKEAAMYAGFCNAQGDLVAVMDADMQDPPSLLPQMLSILETGKYDSVATRRETRIGEPPLRSFFARMFYKIINKISDVEIVDGARDFRLMKMDMVKAIVSMCEYNRFSKGIFGWVGFRTYWLPFENVERVVGKTKWNFWSLFTYAIDGITNFSQLPLTLMSWGGIFLTILSFAMIIFVIFRRLVFGDPVQGWASNVCIITMIGGLQIFSIGVLGQYLAKTYMETKHRPHFVIAETNKEDCNYIK